jgi:23S rRNA (uracil1939-C5)-methyltransferase
VVKLQQQAVVTITTLSHDGRGIAQQEGKTIFVERALPGEQVEIEFYKRKSRYDEARTTRLLTSAPHRQDPQCPHFSICGGCSLQHMDGPTQIAHKQAILLELLQHVGQVAPNRVLPAVTGLSYGYRRKARLGVRYVNKKEKLLIGFREKQGRYLADIEICYVLDESVGQKIPILRDFLVQLKTFQQIPQLEIAVGDDAAAIIIRHLVPLPESDIELIQEFAKSEGFHIYLQPGGPATAHLIYPTLTKPRLSYRLTAYDLEMLFHPTDFTQINREINEKMIQLAIELLAPTPQDNLLDLFCGIGNFSLPFARYCEKVLGVEGCQEMVLRGYENATHNQINNVDFECRNLAEINANDHWIKSNFTKALLDPPRVGAFEILPLLVNSNISQILYVSCNPATLARDAGYLCQHGFMLETVGVLDMFPHTSHVESIALFKRV